MGEPAGEVIPGLEQAVALKPGWPDAHYLLALAYLDGCTADGASTLNLAVDESDEALKRKEDANTYWVRGAAQARLRRWAEAARSYEQSLNWQDDPFTRANLAEAYRMLNRRAEAERVLNQPSVQSANSHAHEVAALSGVADRLYEEDKFAEAALEYQEAISRAVTLQLSKDELSSLHRNLSVTYSKLGRLDAALAEMEQAAALGSRGRFNHTLLAQRYRDLGRTDDAIHAYQTALEIQPCNYEAHLGLAEQYIQSGEFDAALAEYEKARIADPDNGMADFQLADLHYRRGEGDKADQALREAARLFEAQIAREPGNPQPTDLLGRAAFVLGDFGKSITAFEAAARLAPDDAAIRYWLGLAHAQNGDIDAARAAFQSVVDDAAASDALKQDAQKALADLK
jgi:tetratricopeptide (TPR) repeat protein